MAISHLFTVFYWSLNSSCLCHFSFCESVFFSAKAILYTFFAHYFALPSNTTGWNPINRYHATTFPYLFSHQCLVFVWSLSYLFLYWAGWGLSYTYFKISIYNTNHNYWIQNVRPRMPITFHRILHRKQFTIQLPNFNIVYY